MNLYIRYFDKEILVDNVDDAIAFLADIPEIGMNPVLEEDIRNYCASEVFYPKRYKVRPRVYFIIIKTDAPTMNDFKEKRAVHPPLDKIEKPVAPALVRLNEELFGWYEGALDFKRVLLVRERVSSNTVTRISWLIARQCPEWTVITALLSIFVAGWMSAVSSRLLKERISSSVILVNVNNPHP